MIRFLLIALFLVGCESEKITEIVPPANAMGPARPVDVTYTQVKCGHVFYEWLHGPNGSQVTAEAFMLVDDVPVPQADGEYQYGNCAIVIQNGRVMLKPEPSPSPSRS